MKHFFRRLYYFCRYVRRPSTHPYPGLTWWQNRITIRTALGVAGILSENSLALNA